MNKTSIKTFTKYRNLRGSAFSDPLSALEEYLWLRFGKGS